MTSEHGHAGIEMSGMPERGLKTSWTWPRIETLGRSAYEQSFGIRFIEEGDVDPAGTYGFTDRVIPSSCRYGLPDRLRDRSVAIVGNSVITGVGVEIDSHDEVIRMTSMRNWARSPSDDGIRMTMWAGMASQLVKEGKPIPQIEWAISECASLWCLSPFHITCESFNFLRQRNLLQDLLVLPPAACLFDQFQKYMSEKEISSLLTVPLDGPPLPGLTWYERLLTGTRLALLVELCGARHVSLYGFNLFTTESSRLWRGHDVALDRRILEGIDRRLRDAGRGFRWHSGHGHSN